jgi:hypothetical protein
VNVYRILAPVSRRAGTALAVSALALGLATGACNAESTSDAAAPAPASSAAATAPEVTAPGSPEPIAQAVPTAGSAAFANSAWKNCGNGYDGVWLAQDPDAFIASITISQTDCGRLNSARFRVVSGPWLGLGSGYSDWGYAKNISWGYLGTSVTLTYYFQSGLVEKVYILPATNGSTLSAKSTEYHANGTSLTRDTVYYNPYGS